jgi:hypothetical protein
MNERTDFILKFTTNTGEVAAIRIPRADAAMTQAQAQTAMQAMIDLNIIVTGAGKPVGVKSAVRLTTQETDVTPA